MAKEYKIKCKIPREVVLRKMFRLVPNPIHRPTITEIYNFKIQSDGFYFIDQEVDSDTAGVAFRMFIDAALTANETVEISKV